MDLQFGILMEGWIVHLRVVEGTYHVLSVFQWQMLSMGYLI